jgi:hypothetical protein
MTPTMETSGCSCKRWALCDRYSPPFLPPFLALPVQGCPMLRPSLFAFPCPLSPSLPPPRPPFLPPSRPFLPPLLAPPPEWKLWHPTSCKVLTRSYLPLPPLPPLPPPLSWTRRRRTQGIR